MSVSLQNAEIEPVVVTIYLLRINNHYTPSSMTMTIHFNVKTHSIDVKRAVAAPRADANFLPFEVSKFRKGKKPKLSLGKGSLHD